MLIMVHVLIGFLLNIPPFILQRNALFAAPCATLFFLLLKISTQKKNEVKDRLIQAGKDYYPIFFIEVDVTRNRDLFQQLQLNNVPLVTLIPPKSSANNVKLNQLLTKLRKYRFTAMSATMTSQDINDFIFKLTDLKAELEATIAWTDLILYTIAIGTMVATAIQYSEFLRNNRIVFFFLGLSFYLFCISGGMYNFIRNTPFTQVQNGEVYYLARGPRSQYGVESWIVSFVVLISSLTGIHLNRLSFSQSQEPKSEFWKLMDHYFIVLMSPSLAFILFSLSWLNLVRIYDAKHGGYHMGWTIRAR